MGRKVLSERKPGRLLQEQDVSPDRTEGDRSADPDVDDHRRDLDPAEGIGCDHQVRIHGEVPREGAGLSKIVGDRDRDGVVPVGKGQDRRGRVADLGRTDVEPVHAGNVGSVDREVDGPGVDGPPSVVTVRRLDRGGRRAYGTVRRRRDDGDQDRTECGRSGPSGPQGGQQGQGGDHQHAEIDDGSARGPHSALAYAIEIRMIVMATETGTSPKVRSRSSSFAFSPAAVLPSALMRKAATAIIRTPTRTRLTYMSKNVVNRSMNSS